MTRPRVVVADEHQLFVSGIERLLAAECAIVGTATDNLTLLTEVRRLNPDVVVHSLAMGPMNGLDVIREITRLPSGIRVVIVTQHTSPDVAAEAFRHGASGYLLKSSAVSDLLVAVRSAMERRSYVTPLIASGTIEALSKTAGASEADSQLTDRQREVLRLLAGGQSMKQIAAVLNLTARTVAFHKYRMMHSLKIKSSAELVRFAVEQRIV